MGAEDRREFLKRTAATVAGGAGIVAGHASRSADARGRSEHPQHIELPHRPLEVPGVHAYADAESVAAGESIRFHTSSTVPYRLSIFRLGHEVDDPAGDEVLHEFPPSTANPQPIHPGSYIHVKKRPLNDELLGAMTLECWVRPWRTDAWMGLITVHDYPTACGFGLFLEPGGKVSFYTGDGTRYRSEYRHSTAGGAIQQGRWHHLVAVWSGAAKTIWIDGQPARSWPFSGPARTSTAPLRLAAYGEKGLTDHFLDGDLAMPVIYNRALAADEIAARGAEKAQTAPTGEGILACWKLDEERGEGVADSSGNAFDGKIINHATWMIGGPALDANVPRYGNYDPADDPARGHALRFASDDLYDCRWPATHQYRIPSDARPGIYVARCHYEYEGDLCVYHVTFIVKRRADRPKAPLLVLCSTNTWRAYNATPFPRPIRTLHFMSSTAGTANGPNAPPAYSLYRTHAAGQGTYQLGRRVPWPAAGPYVTYGQTPTYSHLMRAERFAHVWLEKAGYQFDVVTDVDLHQDPDLLKGYRCLLINGHSEYWTTNAYDGVKRFLEGGGDVVCLSGNTMFWRVSFNRDASIMECRKVDAPGFQMPPARRGECWHSQDGRRGGLMRDCAEPAWKLLALETLGWNNVHPDQFGPYRVEDPDHFLFQRPEPVGLSAGDTFGEAPGGGLPAANGHEFDVRPSTLRRIQKDATPDGAPEPEDPPGIQLLAGGINRWQHGGTAMDYYNHNVTPPDNLGGEFVYWERPEGGRVLNAGAIGAGWALAADPKFQRLLTNVLFHFGVKPG